MDFGLQVLSPALILGLLAWILKAMYALKGEMGALKGEVQADIQNQTQKIAKMVEKEKEESISAHRRLDIHDAIGSQITEKPFRSKPMVETGEVPKLNRNLQRLVAGAHEND